MLSVDKGRNCLFALSISHLNALVYFKLDLSQLWKLSCLPQLVLIPAFYQALCIHLWNGPPLYHIQVPILYYEISSFINILLAFVKHIVVLHILLLFHYTSVPELVELSFRIRFTLNTAKSNSRVIICYVAPCNSSVNNSTFSNIVDQRTILLAD